MKNRVLARALYILAFLIMFVNTAFAVSHSLFPDIADLPEGKLIKSCVSPQGSYQVNFYLVSNNLGSAVRGERIVGDKHVNIFWQTGVKNVTVQWVNEGGILVNQIPLNLKTDKYDSRRGTSIFSDGVLAENLNEQ